MGGRSSNQGSSTLWLWCELQLREPPAPQQVHPKGIPATCRLLVTLRDGMLGSSPGQQSWFALHKCQVNMFFVSETNISGPGVLTSFFCSEEHEGNWMKWVRQQGLNPNSSEFFEDYGRTRMELTKRHCIWILPSINTHENNWVIRNTCETSKSHAHCVYFNTMLLQIQIIETFNTKLQQNTGKRDSVRSYISTSQPTFPLG